MQLTESFAMYPASSVSGFYLSHPEADYFAIGNIGQDQLDDFCQRTGLTEAAAKKILHSVVE